jgi:hypothetical protein
MLFLRNKRLTKKALKSNKQFPLKLREIVMILKGSQKKDGLK